MNGIAVTLIFVAVLLAMVVWDERTRCPYCGGHKLTKCKDEKGQKKYYCNECYSTFSKGKEDKE